MRRRSTAQGAPVSARLSVAPRDERCAELVRARPVDALQSADKVVRHPPPRCHGVSVARVAIEVVLEQQHLRRGVLSRSSAIATCGRRHGEHRRGRLALARGGDCRRAGLESSRDPGSGYGSYGSVAGPKRNRPPAELHPIGIFQNHGAEGSLSDETLVGVSVSAACLPAPARQGWSSC